MAEFLSASVATGRVDELVSSPRPGAAAPGWLERRSPPPEMPMPRLIVLSSCLLVLGCSTPPSPPAAPRGLVAPSAAEAPADAAWTTGVFATEAGAPAPRAPASQLEQMSSRHLTFLIG